MSFLVWVALSGTQEIGYKWVCQSHLAQLLFDGVRVPVLLKHWERHGYADNWVAVFPLVLYTCSERDRALFGLRYCGYGSPDGLRLWSSTAVWCPGWSQNWAQDPWGCRTIAMKSPGVPSVYRGCLLLPSHCKVRSTVSWRTAGWWRNVVLLPSLCSHAEFLCFPLHGAGPTLPFTHDVMCSLFWLCFVGTIHIRCLVDHLPDLWVLTLFKRFKN